MNADTLEAMQAAGVYYLASPYSHPDFATKDARAAAAQSYSGRILSVGIKNFSPIAYCHPLALRFKLPTDADWWWEFNLAFMEMSAGLIIAQIDGWQDSYGVKLELDWYTKQRGAYAITYCKLAVDRETLLFGTEPV